MIRRSVLACLVPVCLVAAGLPRARAQAQWMLVNSTLSYHVSHSLREVDGVSAAARGKGSCENGTCLFFIAAPVNSFRSGDSNRDQRMLQAVRAAQYPSVVVRATFPDAELVSSTLYADVQVQFAGQVVRYQHVPLQKAENGNQVRITGIIPVTCSDFRIDRPRFMNEPIKNEIPVRVDMTWASQ